MQILQANIEIRLPTLQSEADFGLPINYDKTAVRL